MADMNSTASAAASASSAAAEASASAALAAYYQELSDNYWKYSWEYPHDLYYLCASVACYAALVNLFSIYWAWRRRHLLRRGALIQERKQLGVDTEKAAARPRGKREWRNLPAALLAGSRIVGFRWRIPHVSMTMVELVLSVIYMLTVFLLNFINSVDLAIGNVESRAADLATSQFPLIFALAMKNNVIVFLTGISHEKLNLMHRVLSRVMLIAIWIHWWGCVVRGTDMWGITWVWMGTMSALAQTVLTITSVSWVRKRWYEFFFLSHIVGVFIFLFGAIWHCIGLEDYWKWWMWPCAMIWGQDRACRYIRFLILSNFHAPNKNPAHVALVSADTLCITARRTFDVPMRVGGSWAASKGWEAGQHMFVAFPTIGPIESHPFTIASVCEPLEGDATGRERELRWIVRVRDGFTRRLKEQVAMKKGACDIPIFMDGPYGTPPNITGFDTCVFVAGGSGVAFIVSRFRQLMNQIAKRDACAKHVHFIWAIRHPEHLSWIAKDLAKAVATTSHDIELRIQVYVTSGDAAAHDKQLAYAQSAASSPVSPAAAPPPAAAAEPRAARPQSAKTVSDDDIEKSSTGSGTASYDIDCIKGVEVRYGRPDIHALLEDIVTSATGPVSVDLSGPESLVAAVRSALSSSFAGPLSVLRGGASVQLNVEDFTM